jgi:hypothetical protein
MLEPALRVACRLRSSSPHRPVFLASERRARRESPGAGHAEARHLRGVNERLHLEAVETYEDEDEPFVR